jgi:hypothetical protein
MVTPPLPRVGQTIDSCPYCTGKHIVRKGLRRKKLETVQLWRCETCKKVFTPQPVRGKTFPLRLILDAVSLFKL